MRGRPRLCESGQVFTTAERAEIRAGLVAAAEADPRIVGAALVGSAARGTEDEWSDIDLLLQLAVDADEQAVVDSWTAAIDRAHGVADTLDVFASGARYRVVLLRSSLQIDVSFWPHDRFRATEPGFQPLFGTPNPPSTPAPVDTSTTAGMGWLYAIHARSAIARGRLWQAAMMLDELRSQIIALTCARHGLVSWHGREVDRLPAVERQALEATRVGTLTAERLENARILLTRRLLDEVARSDPQRAARLAPAILALTQTT